MHVVPRRPPTTLLAPQAAWGVLQKKGTQLMVRSYELGALHLPSLEATYLASPWRGYDAVTGTCDRMRMPGRFDGIGLGTPRGAATDDGVQLCVRCTPGMCHPVLNHRHALHPPDATPERLRFVAWSRGVAYEPWRDEEGTIRVPLPIPYTLPPARYKKPGDIPWAVDHPWPGLDHFGCTVEAPHGAFYGISEDMEWADVGRRP